VPKAPCADLRERVAGFLTVVSVGAAQFKVSAFFVMKLVKAYRGTGSVAPSRARDGATPRLARIACFFRAAWRRRVSGVPDAPLIWVADRRV
jgi:hypothetical protein